MNAREIVQALCDSVDLSSLGIFGIVWLLQNVGSSKPPAS
jgi:hypothetical protein